jgi:outer membrane protein assembly factor BamB
MKHLAACLSACLLATIANAGEWPQFRGPHGLGVSAETGLPTSWSKTENIHWKVDLPGRGLSAPVVAGGRVYVTACTGGDQERLHVLCFDARTGKKLWHRQLWATGTTLCHPKTNMAAPTPVTDGQRVYALFATYDLVCLDISGDLVWYRALTRDYPTMGNNVGMASSPVLSRSCLVLALENAGESYALGIDKRTGKNRWQHERAREISWVTPLLIDNNGREEVLIQSPKEMTAFDPETGRLCWRHRESGLATIPSPASGAGLLFVPGPGILAVRPGGEGVAAKTVWKKAKLTTAFASPLYYQGRLYTLNNVGVLTCTEPATGNIVWQLRLKGPFSASPVAGDGKIYLVSETGTSTVVQAAAANTPADSKVAQAAKVLASNELGDTFLATPALADAALYLRSDKLLYCIKQKK